MWLEELRVSSASTVMHCSAATGTSSWPVKSYGCGQRRFFRTATLHSVQLAVCCLQEGFNRFAVLRIGSHPNACGKWRLLTIRCKPIAGIRGQESGDRRDVFCYFVGLWLVWPVL